jgi:hypothetical protein
MPENRIHSHRISFLAKIVYSSWISNISNAEISLARKAPFGYYLAGGPVEEVQP